jgi:hypothetical protein
MLLRLLSPSNVSVCIVQLKLLINCNTPVYSAINGKDSEGEGLQLAHGDARARMYVRSHVTLFAQLQVAL